MNKDVKRIIDFKEIILKVTKNTLNKPAITGNIKELLQRQADRLEKELDSLRSK
jgi:hypothetical protein